MYMSALYGFSYSLEDILHHDGKLYLVFEFMLMDLKKYLDSLPSGEKMESKVLKVSVLPCQLPCISLPL